MESQTHNPGLLHRQALTLTELQQGKDVRPKGRVSRAISKQRSKVRVTDRASAPSSMDTPKASARAQTRLGGRATSACIVLASVLWWFFPNKVKTNDHKNEKNYIWKT